VLCAPLWWARAPCAAPPLRWVLAPCAGAPPRGVVAPTETIATTDRREATALDASIRSLHGDTRGAATHRPTGRVSGGLGRRTPSSTARSRRSKSAEQWCSSQSQPQPQLRYQHLRTGGIELDDRGRRGACAACCIPQIWVSITGTSTRTQEKRGRGDKVDNTQLT